MKKIGNIYDRICDTDNILLADEIARKGKKEMLPFKTTIVETNGFYQFT
jgi:hypothetical protein